MARLGFDIDGVTYNFVDKLRQYTNAKTGKPLREMPDANTWNFFTDQWGLTLQEYLAIVIAGVEEGKIFWQGDAYENAKYYLYQMKYELGHEIVFVTARNFKGIEDKCKQATEYWLNNVFGVNYDELIIVGANDSKVGHDIDVLFDDAPHHIIEWTKEGDHVVAFDQPWNHHIADVPRVVGWLGIFEYVKENF